MSQLELRDISFDDILQPSSEQGIYFGDPSLLDETESEKTTPTAAGYVSVDKLMSGYAPDELQLPLQVFDGISNSESLERDNKLQEEFFKELESIRINVSAIYDILSTDKDNHKIRSIRARVRKPLLSLTSALDRV